MIWRKSRELAGCKKHWTGRCDDTWGLCLAGLCPAVDVNRLAWWRWSLGKRCLRNRTMCSISYHWACWGSRSRKRRRRRGVREARRGRWARQPCTCSSVAMSASTAAISRPACVVCWKCWKIVKLILITRVTSSSAYCSPLLDVNAGWTYARVTYTKIFKYLAKNEMLFGEAGQLRSSNNALVEQKAVSDFYWLKAQPVPSGAL